MYEQVARNKRRTFLLLAGFVVFIAVVAIAFNYLIGFGPIGIALAIVISIAMAFGSCLSGSRSTGWPACSGTSFRAGRWWTS